MRRCVILVLAFALCLPVVAQDQKPLTPETLWAALLAGNQTFATKTIEYKGLTAERLGLVNGQNPPVLILSCSDSRVPPELIFNQSLDALFVVRSAGNVADEFGIASIEYAVSHDDWTRLIVVLGHQNCGAVVEAMKAEDPGSLSLIALVNRIRRSFIMGQVDLKQATEANARASAAWLTAESAIIRKAVMDHRVRIVPAYYDMKTGLVTPVECP
jgi:carbonic anhydrase